MVTVEEVSTSEVVSKSDLINQLSLTDDIIRVGYKFAAKYVVDDTQAFYKKVKGKDYSTLQNDIITQLYQAR